MPAVESRVYPSLFNGDRQACHDAMMEVVGQVCHEIKRDSGEIPEFYEFYRDVRRLWLKVWQHYA
jgi:hypothetical protein